MTAKRTPGPMVADYNTPELPFRIISKTTGGNVGYAYTEADADLFAGAGDLLAALESMLEAPSDLSLASGALRHKARKAALVAIAKARGES